MDVKYLTNYIPFRPRAAIRRRVARLRNPGRHTHLYCVGIAKTGTHSITDMFDSTVRSEHEPEHGLVINKILAFGQGRLDEEKMRRYLRRRDRRLYLEIDSSHLNVFFVELLVEEFKSARFVMTIREPYSWLNSFINHSLLRDQGRQWVRLCDFMFRPDILTHPAEEQVLKERGLYTLEGYLGYWATNIQKVISSVPADQLLIVRTDQITKRAFEIADFSGLPRTAVRPEQSHTFKRPGDLGLLHEIDREYLQQRVSQFCQPLMDKFFPEVQQLSDAVL